MTAVAEAVAKRQAATRSRRRPASPQRLLLYAVLTIAAVLWLTPILWALYTSLRPYSDTAAHGYVSIAHTLTLQNFTDAWSNAGMLQYFVNSVVITVPSVLLALFFASAVAFVISRFSLGFNIALLVLFTAGNLLPQQVIITPLFRMYLSIHVPGFLSSSGTLFNSYLGLIVINTVFQMGFCVFVLSNYMKAIPHSLTEAALIDGASVWTQYWRITLPLSRPALAALATLLTTWIYNDFFWAIVLVQRGDKRPITSALANLQGVYFTNNNLLAAGALITAVPTLVVYALLQRQMIAGLTLGANKG